MSSGRRNARWSEDRPGKKIVWTDDTEEWKRKTDGDGRIGIFLNYCDQRRRHTRRLRARGFSAASTRYGLEGLGRMWFKQGAQYSPIGRPMAKQAIPDYPCQREPRRCLLFRMRFRRKKGRSTRRSGTWKNAQNGLDQVFTPGSKVEEMPFTCWEAWLITRPRRRTPKRKMKAGRSVLQEHNPSRTVSFQQQGASTSLVYCGTSGQIKAAWAGNFYADAADIKSVP